MTQLEAVTLIDAYKNKLINPVEMLHWTWLRVIILKIEPEEWHFAHKEAEEIMSK